MGRRLLHVARRARLPLAFIVPAAAAGLALVTWPREATAALWAAALGTLGLWITRSNAGSDVRNVKWIFLLSFGVRIVAVFVLHYTVFQADPTLLAGDDVANDRLGLSFSYEWRSSGFSLEGWPDYPNLVGIAYYASADLLLLPRVFNAFAGSMAVTFATITAGLIFGERAIKPVGIVGALLPSLIVWSSLNIKEAWALLGVVLICYAVARAHRKGWREMVTPLFLGALILSVIRPWTLFVVAAGVVVGSVLAIPRAKLKALALSITVGLILLLMVSLGAAETELEIVQSQSISEIRESTTVGGSAVEQEVRLTTVGAALRSAPPALVRVLLGPYPWELTGRRQLLALPEMMAWYILLPLIGLGVLRSRRMRGAVLSQFLAIAGAILVAVALLEGNLGLIYRHRLQAFLLLLIFLGGVSVRSRAVRLKHHSHLIDPREPTPTQ